MIFTFPGSSRLADYDRGMVSATSATADASVIGPTESRSISLDNGTGVGYVIEGIFMVSNPVVIVAGSVVIANNALVYPFNNDDDFTVIAQRYTTTSATLPSFTMTPVSIRLPEGGTVTFNFSATGTYTLLNIYYGIIYSKYQL